MNSIPSIKNSILYIFETYFLIKFDLTKFTIEQDNNLFFSEINSPKQQLIKKRKKNH